MARNQETVTCQPGVWTELTNSDVTTITFQVRTGAVKVRCTTGSAPANLSDGGYEYHATIDGDNNYGEIRIAIADLSSEAGADRVFATPLNGRRALVTVDHA
jgi:carbon monoxide dehydrogenase subunit G